VTLATLVVAALTLVHAAVATAATTDRTHVSWDCGGQRGSGQTDRAGNLYVTCYNYNGASEPNIQIFTPGGVLRQVIQLDARAFSVAPSPDGSIIYVVKTGTSAVERWVRSGSTYVHDAGWRLAAFPSDGGLAQPTGEFVAVDASGYIYFSTGTWTNAPMAVVKYAPDGSYVTRMGSYVSQSWALGSFYWMNAGVAVTPDGAHVYVTEVGNNRVQRFDRNADGSYTAAAVVVGNDPNLDASPYDSLCGDWVRAGRLSAPYDVKLDGAGNIYVLNTTCLEVREYTSAGTWLATWGLTTSGAGGYVHGMAVDGAGRVYLAEVDTILRLPSDGGGGVNPAPAAGPAPITDAFKGWAVVAPSNGGASANAWRWNGNGWDSPSSFRAGASVYAWPFAAGWMWAWNGVSWYAMRTADIGTTP
jgi:sugar lactone lactonase YvrE